MPVLIICKFDEELIKHADYRSDNSFPIVNIWELSVSVESRVLIRCAQKLYAAYLPPSRWFILNFIKIGQLASEIFKFESVVDNGQMADHWYTINSPCEPLAPVS